jgi:hypothetical protein
MTRHEHDRFIGKRVTIMRCDNRHNEVPLPVSGTVTGIAAHCGYDTYLRVSIDGGTDDFWSLSYNLRLEDGLQS